ncbi:MAG: J domain-containing protein [Candidatus Desulfatibia sp.]|uniref:J domain-containing protein n=1 Tax=Candidatus Desulfatibia sp. TaxID=3101189 RepID=UPI002F3101D9
MKNRIPKNITAGRGPKQKKCLSCGTIENMCRRRYCSIDCRQKLLYTLGIRTGLLKALNTRYATFYFTEKIIIMDILPYLSREILSFIYPRSNDNKPAEDYCRMSDLLGNEWWAEKKRTHKHYLANRHIYNQAVRNGYPEGFIIPLETKVPAVKGAALTHLKLGKSDLDSPELEKKIKSAYRLQVKKHHPDIGGDTATFRKVHQAYKDLIGWAESPTFLRRRGFPDKWFYDGDTDGWIQPKPYLKK